MSGAVTVLFVVDGHQGHVHATLGLAARLRARGARVVYCGPPALAGLVAVHGYDCRPLPAFTLADRPRPRGAAAWIRHRLGASRRVAERVRRAHREVTALVADVGPGVAVVDPFLLAFYPLLWERGVPVVALSTKPLLRADRATPPYTSRLVPRGPLSGARVRLAWRWQWVRYRAGRVRDTVRGAYTGWSARRLMLALARQVGFPWRELWVARPVSFDVCFDGLLELVLSSGAFELTDRPAPPGTLYAGHCVAVDRGEADPDWSWLDPDSRLVYCSLGTVHRQFDRVAVRLLRTVVRAFAGRPGWSVLVVVPDPVLARSLDAVAPNVRAVGWAPQIAVLRRAAVAVTHGGHNSVKECLVLGVPMVVYPRRADQFGNSARVVRHGVGRRGRAAFARSPVVRRLAESVADAPGVAVRSDRLTRSTTDETGRAVDELLRIAGHRG